MYKSVVYNMYQTDDICGSDVRFRWFYRKITTRVVRYYSVLFVRGC